MAKHLKYFQGNLIEYDILPLVDYYDPILRTPTIPFNFKQPDATKKAEYIMFSLNETLNKIGGLGLSANQIGLKDRVCAVNMGEQIWIMFNPEVLFVSDIPANFSEGCLSYPGLYLKISRPDHVKIKFYDIGGREVIQAFDGLTAVIIQHELDHLDGKVFTDKVSPIALERAKKKIKKVLKMQKKITTEGLEYDEQN